MTISITLQQFLDDAGINYDTVVHTPTNTASQSAEAAHVPGARMVKAVVVTDGDDYMMAVLPASHHLRLAELQDLIDRPVELASEADLSGLFADCDEGAIPPVGMAFGLEVMVDESLVASGDVYFEGGDHATLVHMQADAFEGMMASARHGRFSRHDGVSDGV